MTTTREQLADLADVRPGEPVSNWVRLYSVVQELIGFHRELAMLISQEKERRIQAWFDSQNSGSNSVSNSDRHAEYATLDISTEIIKVKGEIAAFTEERDFLRLVLGGSGVENNGGITNLSS